MDFRVYVVTTEVPELNRTHLDVAREAMAGGATVIQFREKEKKTQEAAQIALQLRRLTWDAGVPLIVNDRIDIALAIQADGIHIGQEDMPFLEAKKIVPGRMLIGASVTNLAEAVKAEREGANYLGVGPIFPTPSKEDAAQPIGIDGLRGIRAMVSIPMVAIGGITFGNIGEVLKAGADGVAVISAVANAPDMQEATRLLRQKIIGD